MSLVARPPDTLVQDAASLAVAIETLRARVSAADRPRFRDRLQAFDRLSDALLSPARDLGAAVPQAGLAFAAAFLRGSHLEHLMARELAELDALDRFMPLDRRKSLRVLPRGVACHWIAGNVPLLGLFSWALSAVVGNVNVLRLSSRTDDEISPIVRRLAEVSPVGAELVAETLIVQFPREDDASHRAMSAAADVRIAWGSRDAVEAVTSLPARWDSETIVMGPRMSVAVVDPALVTDRLLGRLASDIAYFDQQACSSPQWLFVKASRSSAAFTTCLERFAEAFARQSRTLRRHPLDFGETYRIELDRARTILDGGDLRRDDETAWTVAVLDAPSDRVACANRFVQVIPIDDLSRVVDWLPDNVQTSVTLLSPGDAEAFTNAAAMRGVCRFPRPGEGNNFENPWDGIPLISRLTRWSVRTEPAE